MAGSYLLALALSGWTVLRGEERRHTDMCCHFVLLTGRGDSWLLSAAVKRGKSALTGEVFLLKSSVRETSAFGLLFKSF